jgi:hypothetical protein
VNHAKCDLLFIKSNTGTGHQWIFNDLDNQIAHISDMWH